MSTPVPSTTIILYKGVPLSSRYTDTYLFDDKEQQFSYLNSHFTHITLNSNQYQRKDLGVIRVSVKYEDCYNVNYCTFTNIGHDNKTFYCFVNKVEYLNENVSLIYYSIDVIQSYINELEFNKCLIIRNHTQTDELFEHLEDEKFTSGDSVYSTPREFTFDINLGDNYSLSIPYFAAQATCDENYKDISDGVNVNTSYNGILSGYKLIIKKNVGGIIEWLNNIPAAKEGAVVGVSVVPQIAAELYMANPSVNGAYYIDCNAFVDDYYTDIDGYFPKNKKLFSYPYNFLIVNNSDGAQKEYRFEYLKNDSFTLCCCITVPFSCVLYPTTYKDSTTSKNYLGGIYSGNIPPLSWASDSYKAWYALNSGYNELTAYTASEERSLINRSYKVAQFSNFLGTVVPSFVASASLMSGNVVGAVSAGVMGANAGLKQQQTDISHKIALLHNQETLIKNEIALDNAKKMPDQFNGSQSNNLIVASWSYGFYYRRSCLRADYAKILDDYFTMFGYAINKLDRPKLANRTRFTYIKTSSCDCTGEIPDDDMNLINSIFDNGIRFWKDYDNFLNYDIDNVPIGGGE